MPARSRLRRLQVKGEKRIFSAAKADISDVANQRTAAVGKRDRQIWIRFTGGSERQCGKNGNR